MCWHLLSLALCYVREQQCKQTASGRRMRSRAIHIVAVSRGHVTVIWCPTVRVSTAARVWHACTHSPCQCRRHAAASRKGSDDVSQGTWCVTVLLLLRQVGSAGRAQRTAACVCVWSQREAAWPSRFVLANARCEHTVIVGAACGRSWYTDA